MNVNVDVVRSVPQAAEVVGVPVATTGAVPRQLGLSRAALGLEPGQLVYACFNRPEKITPWWRSPSIQTQWMRTKKMRTKMRT
jgi:hypothetical protein